MSAPLDWLRFASDSRVVAVVLARNILRRSVAAPRAGLLANRLRAEGITATEEQARVLLDVVAAWDEAEPVSDCCYACTGRQAAFIAAAVTAIVRE